MSNPSLEQLQTREGAARWLKLPQDLAAWLLDSRGRPARPFRLRGRGGKATRRDVEDLRKIMAVWNRMRPEEQTRELMAQAGKLERMRAAWDRAVRKLASRPRGPRRSKAGARFRPAPEPVPEGQAVLLFSYGSNSPAQLEERLGRPLVEVRPAIAPGFVREFRGHSQTWGGGVATLDRVDGHAALGFVTPVTERDLKTLDRYEGVGQGAYQRIELDLLVGKKPRAVVPKGPITMPLPGFKKAKAIAYVQRPMVVFDPHSGQPFRPPSSQYAMAVLDTISSTWDAVDFDPARRRYVPRPFTINDVFVDTVASRLRAEIEAEDRQPVPPLAAARTPGERLVLEYLASGAYAPKRAPDRVRVEPAPGATYRIVLSWEKGRPADLSFGYQPQEFVLVEGIQGIQNAVDTGESVRRAWSAVRSGVTTPQLVVPPGAPSSRIKHALPPIKAPDSREPVRSPAAAPAVPSVGPGAAPPLDAGEARLGARIFEDISGKLLVLDVIQGGAAARDGLRREDWITHIDGKPATTAELRRAVKEDPHLWLTLRSDGGRVERTIRVQLPPRQQASTSPPAPGVAAPSPAPASGTSEEAARSAEAYLAFPAPLAGSENAEQWDNYTNEILGVMNDMAELTEQISEYERSGDPTLRGDLEEAVDYLDTVRHRADELLGEIQMVFGDQALARIGHALYALGWWNLLYQGAPDPLEPSWDPAVTPPAPSPPKTVVLNLETGEEKTYTLPPRQALIAAWEQSQGNWNTWTYDASKAPIQITPHGGMTAGDWMVKRANPPRSRGRIPGDLRWFRRRTNPDEAVPGERWAYDYFERGKKGGTRVGVVTSVAGNYAKFRGVKGEHLLLWREGPAKKRPASKKVTTPSVVPPRPEAERGAPTCVRSPCQDPKVEAHEVEHARSERGMKLVSRPLPKSPLSVSLGLGVDSVAILVGLEQLYRRTGKRMYRPDYILFADTGAEKPETYAYLTYLDNWLDRVGFPRVTVVAYATAMKHNSYGSSLTLEQQCLVNHTMPSISQSKFQYAKCSKLWKQDAMSAWLKEYSGLFEHRRWGWELPAQRKDPTYRIVKAIGYDASETERHKKGTFRTKDDRDSSFSHYWYPLMEWGWDRARCVAEIERAIGVVPVKSSCFFCGAMTREEILALPNDLLLRAILIEEVAKRSPRLRHPRKLKLAGMPPIPQSELMALPGKDGNRGLKVADSFANVALAAGKITHYELQQVRVAADGVVATSALRPDGSNAAAGPVLSNLPAFTQLLGFRATGRATWVGSGVPDEDDVAQDFDASLPA